MSRALRKSLAVTLAAACVGNTVFCLLGYPAQVHGSSMKPTLNGGERKYSKLAHLRLDSDWVFVNCWAVRNYALTRGDIVVFVSPRDPNDYVIKRVLALEDDVVESTKYSGKTVVVPKGHCWVEGDNSKNSVDSNKYGPISTGLVFGKATHIIFPPEKWQNLSSSKVQHFSSTVVRANHV